MKLLCKSKNSSTSVSSLSHREGTGAGGKILQKLLEKGGVRMKCEILTHHCRGHYDIFSYPCNSCTILTNSFKTIIAVIILVTTPKNMYMNTFEFGKRREVASYA